MVAPDAPTALAEVLLEETSVTISATASASTDVVAYNGYYRETGSGSYVKHNVSGISEAVLEAGYLFNGLTTDTEYQFYFTATDDDSNESSPSVILILSTVSPGLATGWYDSSSVQDSYDLTDMTSAMRLSFAVWHPVQEKFYIPGPYNGSTYVNTMYIYDPITGVWTTGSSLQSPRERRGIFVLSDDKILFGGGFIGGGYFSTYDPVTDAYANDMLNNRDSRICGQAFDPATDALYYSGDESSYGQVGMTSNVVIPPGSPVVYNSVPNADTMFIGTMTFYDDLVYVLPRNTGSDLQSFMSFNPATDTYTALASTPFNIVRGYMWVYNGNIYVNVGNDNTPSTTITNGIIYKYDVIANSWSLVTDSMPTPSQQCCYAIKEGGKELWCFGGVDGSGINDKIQVYVVE